MKQDIEIPSNTYQISVFAGDGIGHEITPPCLEVLQHAAGRNGFSLTFESLPGGAQCYADTGEALPERSIAGARTADAILLAAMGLPHIRYPDGTEIAPQVDLRVILGLYAGVRPAEAISPAVSPLKDPRGAAVDFVLIRESTEGLFKERRSGIVSNNEARDSLVITREGTQRVVHFAFQLARQRKARGGAGRVTCVDKANVFKSFAFFRTVFDEVAALYPDIRADHAYVDAMALNLIRRPWEYDVLVTENMFGDILSDLSAALVGGLGMAPSADIGDSHAVFQPCHGTAPDIAGQNKANPLAMFLSGAMMLEWLGETRDDPRAIAAGAMIRRAVKATLARLTPMEFGGTAGTKEVAAAVIAALAPASAAA